MTAGADPFLKGRLFYLRPVRRTDYDAVMTRWLSDRTVTRFLSRGTFPQTTEQLSRQYDQLITSSSDIEFTIALTENDAAIGVVGLHSMSWIARHAELRILIGERQSWRQGIGTEACQLICSYGFEVLNFQKVWLGVSAGNLAALTAYRLSGFQEEGRLRNELFRNGRYYDVVRMSMLEAEYRTHSPNWPCASLIAEQLRNE